MACIPMAHKAGLGQPHRVSGAAQHRARLVRPVVLIHDRVAFPPSLEELGESVLSECAKPVTCARVCRCAAWTIGAQRAKQRAPVFRPALPLGFPSDTTSNAAPVLR